MRGLRAAGGRVDHLLGVAVVGGDDHGSAGTLEGSIDLAEAGINGFDGFDGGRNLAGVADHVGVGEVHHHDVEGLLFDGLDDGVGNALRRHLGLEVVGGDLGRLDQHAVFARERLLDPPLKK